MAYRTNAYKLHFYETLSKIRFVMLTDPWAETAPIREAMRYIHEAVYVEAVSKNALIPSEGYIVNELFKSLLNKYITGLPQYTSTSDRERSSIY